MFCIHCGQGNLDKAKYCFACGRPIEVKQGGDVIPAASETGSPEQVTAAETKVPGDGHEDSSKKLGGLPYAWGQFQGWASIVISSLAFCYGFFRLNDASLHASQRQDAFEYILWPFIAIPMGIGILKKRKWVLPLIYVNLGLGVLAGIAALAQNDDATFTLAFWHTIFWVPSAYYYNKRRTEFR